MRSLAGAWFPTKTSPFSKWAASRNRFWHCKTRPVDAVILSEPFSTVAIRAGSLLVADLSQLGVPYTMHGFGVRKSFIRANRDVTVRFMKAYLEGIYVFKTNKTWRLTS